MSLKAGDTCEIVADYGGEHGWTIGLECTVIGPFAMQWSIHNFLEGPVNRLGWRISIAGHDHVAEWVACLGEIRKKAPPDEKTDIESLDEVVA